MTDATTRATELLADQARWDEVLESLRTEGFSKVGSIRATSEVLRIPLSEAKRRVHSSRTWADRRGADEEFHQSLTEATLASRADTRGEREVVPWNQVWERVALDLAGHTSRGNLNLLTEGSVRWATAVWLQRFGITADQLHVEVPTSDGGRIDLVVEPGLAAIEFKFPRPPRSGAAPLTQHAGSILADIIRVASHAEYTHRFAVIVLLPALERHISGRRDVPLPVNAGELVAIDAKGVALLPETARRQLPESINDRLPVEVRCSASYRSEAFAVVAYEAKLLSTT